MAIARRLEELLAQGRALVAERHFRDAQAVFAQAHAAATADDEPVTAALALLGKAQAEFQGFLLKPAADDARAALESLTRLGMSQAKQAADLTIQIDHHLRLR